MAKKKHKTNKPHGHYCYVCGKHKPNEKFSGSGHAHHICRQCQKIPVEKRNEITTINKIYGMEFRFLSKAEINWLRGKMDDPRAKVSEAARQTHDMKFPRYKRNMIKKNLTAKALEFYIRGEVWNEYGEEISVHMRFFADNTGILRRIDYNSAESEQETIINIGQTAMLKFLKSVVHQFDAPFWCEDLSDDEPIKYDPYLDILPEYHPGYDYPDYDYSVVHQFDAPFLCEDLSDDEPFEYDPYLDIFPEYHSGYDYPDYDYIDFDGDDDNDKPEPEIEDMELVCSLRLVLTKGIGEITQTFYNQLHDMPQDLFWVLMALFEPETDDFDEGDSAI